MTGPDRAPGEPGKAAPALISLSEKALDIAGSEPL